MLEESLNNLSKIYPKIPQHENEPSFFRARITHAR
jgi:hypothetical protein